MNNLIKNAGTWLLILTFAVLIGYTFLIKPETPVNVEKNRQDNARVFCAMGRQWIEFANGTATWGAPVLDIDGRPVRCNSVSEPNFTKG